jgi:hypothetical protein
LNRIGGCCTGAKPGGFGAGFVGGVKMCGGVMTVFDLAAGAGLTGVENERRRPNHASRLAFHERLCRSRRAASA